MGTFKDFNKNFSFAIEEVNNNDFTKRYNSYNFNNITLDEFTILKEVSLDKNFLLTMDKLKSEDIVEFNLKMSQFKSNTQQPSNPLSQPSGVPKCPTCGSTDIKKISGGKRWLTTGIFGLASSNVGKTMQCNSCGAKW